MHEEKELDSDPDFGLAPLDDGRVICLRCTELVCSMKTAKIHYREQHMTKNDTQDLAGKNVVSKLPRFDDTIIESTSNDCLLEIEL